MFLLPLLLIPAALAAPAQNFLNTAIARTIELGGTTSSVQTQYSVKALSDRPGLYWLAIGQGVGWWEVSMAGKVLEVEEAVEEG